MIHCEAMSDRMVAVAHNRATWGPEESGHLASCADCAAEWRLVQTASSLGGAGVHHLDAGEVGRTVLDRLSVARLRARRWRRVGWTVGLAAAATIAALVWVGPRRGPGLEGENPTIAAENFELPVTELYELDAGQLQAVLDQLDAPLGSATSPEAPALGDLKASELERVLRSLEG
jgi:hypothetical protein